MTERPSGEAAIAWLKEHVREHGVPTLGITWDVAPQDDPAVMAAILNILFRPQRPPNAA